MKKLLLSLVCLFALVSLVACGQTNEEQKPDNGGTTTPTEATYKLGMGVVVGIGHAQADADIQVDSTVAAVVLDEDGKIVACRIDALQNIASVTAGVPTSSNLTSKAVLGDNYGMAVGAQGWGDMNGDGKVLEWYQQAQAFEAYVTGKTVTEVEAMKTEANGHGYQMSTDADLLKAGCTIQITEFRDAVVAACKDDQFATFTTDKEFKLGVSAIGTFETAEDQGFKHATATEYGTACLYAEYACSVVVDGKIVASINDAVQPKLEFGFNGEEGTLDYTNTKRGLKYDYYMSAGAQGWGDMNGDGKVLEWFEQSLAFSNHVVGMTGEEVANMKTEANGHGYQMSTDADLLKAGCTIQITTIKAVVALSVTNAR